MIIVSVITVANLINSLSTIVNYDASIALTRKVVIIPR